MKMIDLLIIAKPMIDALDRNGVSVNSVRYIDLYTEYIQMASSNHKKAYIEVVLCEKYKISRAYFYKIIKTFEQTACV